MILDDFLQYFSLNSILNDIKTSLFGVFINGFRGVQKVRIRTVPAFFIDFIGLLAIFFSFFILFDGK